ncbi:hypothetical protein QB607_003024 [Clostridium botulinum]|nr:hypothetical protein [Clostridium botulinum]EKS4395698.1 hypothetical protein [Clostridium botulinum]
MTDKQRNLLEKYITEDNINKLNNLGFQYVSNFIKLILNTCSYSICSIDICNKIECESTEIEFIEKIINSDRKRYTKIHDEYISLYGAYTIPEYDKKIYKLRQTWYKGMSNSPTHNYITITEDCELYKGIYNTLIELKIYSIYAFMNYLKRNKFIEGENK